MRRTTRALLAALALALAGCASAPRYLIVDTHIDAPYRLYRSHADLGVAAAGREFDYPKARAGGLDVAFMSIYTPAQVAGDGGATQLANDLIDLMEALADRHPDKFAIVACAADAEALPEGLVGLALGMENASPLAAAGSEDVAPHLDHFARRGVRYVAPAHSRSNEYADSSYDLDERWQGLSPAGRRLIEQLNARGLMVDVSHLSDAATAEVLEISTAPVIASHSSLRHFIPGFHRNLGDDLVRAVAANGGVIQINFGSGFVADAARRWSIERDAAALAHFARRPQVEPGQQAMAAFAAEYAAAHPYPFADIDTVLDHIDRTVALAGIDHVGLGSDFDGVGDTLPTGLKHVGDYPNLIAGLERRGYGRRDIAKILGGNLLRVWRAVEAQGPPPECRLGDS